MKKSLTIIFVLLFFSTCKKNNTNTNSINPPNWIIGRWIDNVNGNTGFEFKSDNFCAISSYQTTCYKTLVEQNNVEVNEYITNNSYKIKFDVNIGTQITSYEFEKIANNEIIYYHPSGILIHYFKQ